MNFLPPAIEQYAQNHTSPESELLALVNRETHLKQLQPRMLSGHVQGRFLSMVSSMIKPVNALEIGAYTGYSALCIAEGLSPEGKLTSIEANPEFEPIIKGYLNQSPYASKVNLIIGDAKAVIPTLNGPFDLVFIDADKENYPTYFALLADKISVGGYLLVDNVLWSGKVAQDVPYNDYETIAIKELNATIQADVRFENILLPIRDGLMLARRIA